MFFLYTIINVSPSNPCPTFRTLTINYLLEGKKKLYLRWVHRGRTESTEINRYRVGDGRALPERMNCSIMAPKRLF
jgi:hypothetical protein